MLLIVFPLLVIVIVVIVVVLALAAGVDHLQIGDGDDRRDGTYKPKIGHVNTLAAAAREIMAGII